MDVRQALSAFGALSQETRLAVVRTLVVAGPAGLAAGAIAERRGVSPSNISFHLKELERAGLVAQRRESRSLVYSASYETLAGLLDFLMNDCCAGHPDIRNAMAQRDDCCTADEAAASEDRLRV